MRAALLLCAVLLAASCEQEATETWGFVAVLGSDTTSVERMTRKGNEISGDAVGRSPIVVRRRWRATVASDGSVQRWIMDTHIPNAPANESTLHHEFHRSDGIVRLVRRTGSTTVNKEFTDRYVRTVPWNAFVYGTYELLFQAANELPDSTHVGQYFFEGWSEGLIGHARVQRLGNGRLSLRSTGLAGAGVARVDEQGNLLSYSGAGTTYKQEVSRRSQLPDMNALFERFAAEEKAKGVSRALSARDTTRATLGRTTIIVDYSRPFARGRTLLGGLIPYDSVWRTGANAATQLAITAPLQLGGVRLDSGRYTLWTLPRRDGVQLIINRQTGQWGTGYQATHDLARVAMHVDSLHSPVERFTIRVDTVPSRLVLEWGAFRWSVRVSSPQR